MDRSYSGAPGGSTAPSLSPGADPSGFQADPAFYIDDDPNPSTEFQCESVPDPDPYGIRIYRGAGSGFKPEFE